MIKSKQGQMWAVYSILMDAEYFVLGEGRVDDDTTRLNFVDREMRKLSKVTQSGARKQLKQILRVPSITSYIANLFATLDTPEFQEQLKLYSVILQERKAIRRGFLLLDEYQVLDFLKGDIVFKKDYTVSPDLKLEVIAGTTEFETRFNSDPSELLKYAEDNRIFVQFFFYGNPNLPPVFTKLTSTSKYILQPYYVNLEKEDTTSINRIREGLQKIMPTQAFAVKKNQVFLTRK